MGIEGLALNWSLIEGHCARLSCSSMLNEHLAAFGGSRGTRCDDKLGKGAAVVVSLEKVGTQTLNLIFTS